MSGIGIIIRAAGKIGGRVLGRIAGPLGAIITVGELGYLGLKYSGTLENFNKLYCDKCRSEIPMKYVRETSSKLGIGEVFEISCPSCHQVHALTKLHLLCKNCKDSGKTPHKINVPSAAKYFLLTCPNCDKSIKFVKNKYC